MCSIRLKHLPCTEKNLYTSTVWSHRRKLLYVTTQSCRVWRKFSACPKSVVTQAKTAIRDHINQALMYHEGLEMAWRLPAAGIGTVIWVLHGGKSDKSIICHPNNPQFVDELMISTTPDQCRFKNISCLRLVAVENPFCDDRDD